MANLAVEGQNAPGGGSFVSLNANLAVNELDQVAFWADTNTTAGIFLWTDGTIEALAREGDPVPALSSTIGLLFKGLALSGTGTVSFSADMAGGDTGLFLTSGGAGIAPSAW